MKIHSKMVFILLAALTVLLGADSVCVGAVNFTVTPAAISNTYNGTITLQVTGLTSGDTVVVQKFLDANTNGVVGAGDLLVQQFDLTDGQAGMVIGGVTNINVPGDTDSTAGQITAKLNFPGGEFMQSIVGNYLFVLSSPVGHFSPVTNVFNVTNFPFAQKITGSVVSNDTSTTLPNSVVVFFPAPSAGQNGPNGNPLAGVVADNSGAYTIQLPPGTYVPMAFKSNCVANYSASPVLTLGISQTITTNLTLINATASISGTVVDAANSSIGLPGLLEPASASSGLISIGFTDTNGNFTIPVTSGQWKLDGGPQGLALHGYVAYNNGTNVNAGTTGFVGAFYQANALFYGKVKDDSGNPLPGIAIGASDNNNDIFYIDGYSDANGNYVAGAVGGLGAGDPWQVGVDNKSEFPNYLFSQSALNQNGGTNLAVGQAVQQKFTAILATNHITGNVQFDGTNVVGVGVYAFANINGNNYQAQMDTDSNGNYSLNVANGTGGTTWNVNVYDCGCSDNDSLNNILGNGNYQLPSSQNVTINNNNGTANFTISPPQPLQMTTSKTLPDGTVGMSYNQSLNASGGQPPFNWWLPGGTITLPPGVSGDMNFSSDGTSGTISGTPRNAWNLLFLGGSVRQCVATKRGVQSVLDHHPASGFALANHDDFPAQRHEWRILQPDTSGFRRNTAV